MSAPTFDRRRLLQTGAALALPLLFSCCKRSTAPGSRLRPDPLGLLDLPEGFSVRVLQRSGEVMSDGLPMPQMPDGMGCFPGAEPGTLVLMRNHELGSSGGAFQDRPVPPQAYDAAAAGGVTRVVLDAATLQVRSSNVVLTGTRRNCAGGASPWGWLTCEEDLSDRHGYVFLCDPAAGAVQAPVRIPALGRMNHEAALVDPASGLAYLTEDRSDSCFYRFVPDQPLLQPGPETTGKLQALRVIGSPARDMNLQVAEGDAFPVDWVDLPRPTAQDDSLRLQGRKAGAAVFRRGEGLFLHQDGVLFTATTGGPSGGGQLWRYRPQSAAGGTLELVAQADDRAQLDMPDNLCVAPWGDVVMAEDGGDLRWPGNFLRVLTPDGRRVDLARNARSSSEIAGVCFSPAADALFCNLQVDGLTLLITGPFQQLTAEG